MSVQLQACNVTTMNTPITRVRFTYSTRQPHCYLGRFSFDENCWFKFLEIYSDEWMEQHFPEFLEKRITSRGIIKFPGISVPFARHLSPFFGQWKAPSVTKVIRHIFNIYFNWYFWAPDVFLLNFVFNDLEILRFSRNMGRTNKFFQDYVKVATNRENSLPSTLDALLSADKL